MAEGRIRPGGPLQKRAQAGAVPTEGEAEASPAPARKKNEQESARFTARLRRRLGQIAVFRRAAPSQPVRLFCQDESRVGLKLPTPKRLTGFGVKPRQQVDPHYEYYWLYAAVEPKTGESFWLEMPRLDSLCFEVYLWEMRKAFPKSLNVILLDNAPAHIARSLKVPPDTVLLYLPAYCPELNPVERLWQDLKEQIDVFDQEVRSSLNGLKEHVAEIIRAYLPETVASLTGYTYLIDAVDALYF